MLGLGTQELRPQGGRNTKQPTMISSIRLPSQSWLEHRRPRRGVCITPIRLETSFSQPNLQTRTGRSPGNAASVAQSNAVKETLHCRRAVHLGGGIFLLPQSISLDFVIQAGARRKRKLFGFGIKCVLKAGHPLLKLCPQEWKMCSISRDVMLSILLIYIF